MNVKSLSQTYFQFKNLGSLATLLSLLFLMGFSNDVKATHAMGMDLTYEQISQDTFLITLAFYRDCSGVAAPNSATLNLRSASCNRDFNITLPRVGTGNETTPVCASLITQCNGGTFPGSEEYIYQRLIVLPEQCTDWVISNRICCRNNAITTIFNPGNQNIYVEAQINNFNSNNSPIFSNNPVPFVCANQTYCFNNGAIDPEGDSLAYILTTPRTNTGLGDTVSYRPGYTHHKPLTSNPNITLDPITGDLCMFPTDSTEIAILAIRVDEYRNGVLIGSIMRDIQLRILGCPNGNSLPIVSGIDSSNNYTAKVCANSNLSFNIYSADNDSINNVTMTWNQAIPGASFTFTPGSRPVGTFSWTPDNSHIRSQPYCFTVQVADDNCPFNGIQVFSYCIYVVGVKAIVDSTFNPICPGECNGRATATLINGIPPFNYSWNDALNQVGPRAANLCSGTYVVTGTDSTGCTTSDSITLIEPLPMILEMDSIPISCNGGNDGQAVVFVQSQGNPPFSYLWSPSASSQSTDTANGLTTGYHSVTVTDSDNCEVSDSVFVTEPPILTLAMITVANVSCNGLNDGEATAIVGGGSPPYTYQWDSLSGFQTTDTAFNLLAGSHILTITDAEGCMVTDTIIITEPMTAIDLTLSKTNISCKGDSTGSATVTASGGTPPYTYTWDPGTGNQTTATASNLLVGIYTVVVTDLNNCVAYPNIAITEPDTALTLNGVDSFVNCFGDLDGVAGVIVTGGTSPYTYLWDAGTGSQTTAYASSLAAGTYTVLVTDTLGCDDSVDVDILSSSAPLVLTGSHMDVTCNNGSDGFVAINISGGQPSYNIQWDSAAGFQTTDTAFNLKAGTYQVVVLDSFLCSVDTSVTLHEPPPLLALSTFSTNVSCRGDSNGTASVGVTGGIPPYSYLWSPNTGSQTTDTAIGLKTGVYFVTVYDSNYCITSPAIFVEEPNFDLSASLSVSDANCFAGNDGFAIASAFGGTSPYTFQWDSAAAFQTSDTATGLSVGMYSVTVTDSNNCTFDTSATISQPSIPLTINLNSTPVSCFAGSDGSAIVAINGGTSPYTILWDSTTNFRTTDTVIDLASAYYNVVITDDNGCVISDSVFVDGPPEPVVATLNTIKVSCFGLSDGLAIANASGGTSPYTYLWGSNASNQANDTAFNLIAGTYTVTVSDINMCDTSFNVIVEEPDILTDSIYIASGLNGVALLCAGDSNGMAAVLPIGGTAPYTILWDSTAGNQTNDTAFGLTEGVYSVNIEDTNGCVTSDIVSIGSPPKVSIAIGSYQPVNCKSGTDGSVEVIGTGGTSPYTYEWDTNPIQTTAKIDSLTRGFYTVTVRDTNQCRFDTTLFVDEPDSLFVNAQGIDAKCFDEASGMGVAAAIGGVAPYLYFWEVSPGIFQINDTANSLDSGMYIVTARDINNCEAIDTIYVSHPPEIIVTPSVGDTICALQPVTISASASGGFLPYIYNWTPFFGTTGPSGTVAPSQSTSYSVVAVDNNQCESSPELINILVRNFDQDFLSVTASGDICRGDSASIFAVHSGLFGGYTYIWNTGQTGLGTQFVTPDTATYYVFTVTDPCLNELKDSVLIDVFENPVIDLPEIFGQGCEPLDVAFADTSNAGMNVTYFWEFGDGNGSNQSNPNYTYVSPGTYNVVVTITSVEGCSSDNQSNPSEVIVNITPQAKMEISPRVVDELKPVVEIENLTDDNSTYSYLWLFGDGDTSNLKDPKGHIFTDTGLFRVALIVTTPTGCADTTASDVVVKPFYRLEIPNAFTPNPGGASGGKWNINDLSNQIFYPFTETPEAVSIYKMQVFNRWGELLFETDDIYTGWDGYYRNKLSSQEVYVYRINLTWENGQEVESFGDVTLFR